MYLKIINRGLMVRPFLIGLLASDFVNYQSTTSYQIRDIVVFENLLLFFVVNRHEENINDLKHLLHEKCSH